MLKSEPRKSKAVSLSEFDRIADLASKLEVKALPFNSFYFYNHWRNVT